MIFHQCLCRHDESTLCDFKNKFLFQFRVIILQLNDFKKVFYNFTANKFVTDSLEGMKISLSCEKG